MNKVMNLMAIMVVLAFTGCIPQYEVPTHQTVLVWTDVSDSVSYELIAGDLNLGTMRSYEGDHSCMSGDYITFDIPISEAVTFAVKSDMSDKVEIASILIYKGNSGASIKGLNGGVVEMDGTSHEGCTMVYLSW